MRSSLMQGSSVTLYGISRFLIHNKFWSPGLLKLSPVLWFAALQLPALRFQIKHEIHSDVTASSPKPQPSNEQCETMILPPKFPKIAPPPQVPPTTHTWRHMLLGL